MLFHNLFKVKLVVKGFETTKLIHNSNDQNLINLISIKLNPAANSTVSISKRNSTTSSIRRAVNNGYDIDFLHPTNIQ